jgi:putative endonuclease
MWTVYVLKCNDGTYYTGCTADIIDRLSRHNNGQVKYTSSRLPIDLIVTINFSDKYKAYNFEIYLKSGSGRAFMNKRLI